MIEAANSPELRSALEQHLQETKNQVSRLKRVFSIVGAQPKAEYNDIFDEMASATKDLIDDIKTPRLRDAALIVSGNKVEHYEMAMYGSLISFAEQLGFERRFSCCSKPCRKKKMQMRADPAGADQDQFRGTPGA